MISLDYQLFLGYPISTPFQKELDTLPLQVRSLWIQDHPDYLQPMNYQNVSYLGKSLGDLVEMHSLELVEAHIYSILSQLVVNYPYKKDLLVLLALPFNPPL